MSICPKKTDDELISGAAGRWRLQPSTATSTLVFYNDSCFIEEVNSQTNKLIWILEMTSRARVMEDMRPYICIGRLGYRSLKSSVVQSNIMTSYVYGQSRRFQKEEDTRPC